MFARVGFALFLLKCVCVFVVSVFANSFASVSMFVMWRRAIVDVALNLGMSPPPEQGQHKGTTRTSSTAGPLKHRLSG